MQQLKTLILSLMVFLGAAAIAVAQEETIKLKAGSDGQNFLTDAKGMTLYYYTKDARGESVCYGNCANAWPIFYAPTISVPPTLQASDFGTITRTDGSKQTTYRGWPLYYWQRDAKPGDITGEKVGGVWFVIDPAKFPPTM